MVRWEVSTTEDEEGIPLAFGVKVEGSEEEIVARGAVSLQYARIIADLWNERSMVTNQRSMVTNQRSIVLEAPVEGGAEETMKKYALMVGKERRLLRLNGEIAIFASREDAVAEAVQSCVGLWTCVVEYRDGLDGEPRQSDGRPSRDVDEAAKRGA